MLDLRRLKVYNIFNGTTMVGENFEKYAFQIVSNHHFRVMISWKEGTNQVKIGHKIRKFK